jgi:hypothetical protein
MARGGMAELREGGGVTIEVKRPKSIVANTILAVWAGLTAVLSGLIWAGIAAWLGSPEPRTWLGIVGTGLMLVGVFTLAWLASLLIVAMIVEAAKWAGKMLAEALEAKGEA